MVTILDKIKNGETIISDGATGTYLQGKGLEPGGCPEELNISMPNVIKGMAEAYFNAGSDMVMTNSFGGNWFMLDKYGYGDKVYEFNKSAAEHARSVAPSGKYVMGSVGPTGEFVEPLGLVSRKQMQSAFYEQITGLKDGGVDGVVIETMTSLEEAELAIHAAKATGLVAMATMTFDKGPRGYFTMMGVTPEQAASKLKNAGADIIGSNCGNGILNMIDIAAQLREVTDSHLLIHSNAGMPEIRKGQIVYPETPEWMSEKLLALVEAGVNIVGGCCGTTPAHIKAFKNLIAMR